MQGVLSGDHVGFSGGTYYGPVTGMAEHHHQGPAPTATAALPVRPAAFTGRDAAVEQLLAALGPGTGPDGEPVLISAVAGLGGIGKTALAVHTAHAARERGWFPGGALFVDLRGYDSNRTTADQAVLSLLRALGVRDADVPATPADQYALYRSQLAGREPVLVVLDNVSDPAQVEPLLPGEGRHRVLLTSRDTLDWLPTRLVRLDELAPDAAVALVERLLRNTDPADDRAAREPDALRELCALCGHLPLALLVTTAQLRRRRRRPVSALVEELREAQDLLGTLSHGTGGARDLRSVFDVSCARLGPDQRRLFRLLGQAPVNDVSTRTAAVLADLTESAVLRLLEDLDSASLVTPSADGTRWRMHDLVRAHALGIGRGDLPTERDNDVARARLLAHYARHARAADVRWRASRSAMPDGDLFDGREAALAWLDAERAGLVGATAWTDRPGCAEHVVAVGLSLSGYLQQRRYLGDAAAVTRAAREAAVRCGDRMHEGSALTHHANALMKLDRRTEAIVASQQALAIYTELRVPHGVATASCAVGNALYDLRRFVEALTAFTGARRVFAELGDQDGVANTWNGEGLVLAALGRHRDAKKAFLQARSIYADQGNPLWEGITWHNLATALGDLGQVGAALTAFRRAAALLVEVDDWYRVAETHLNIATLLAAVGRDGDAAAAWTAAAGAYERAGAPDAAADCRRRAAGKAGRHDDSRS
ncbi:ATP-binding protein [Streptomyces sp. NBC_01334]|uniref:ATP-binding protein n=1 Tax=Streptomyces sp. NBC_01334 TaxID=2903827 RepID=UPI002E0E3FAA|nr:tetratricopeptide repeat protein [Streptomyces sp. NBC_01334]